MEAFGDVSGHFRGLIQYEVDVVVVGVVFGDRIAAGRCPKRAVRDVTDIPEAKWNDLNDVQKRRLMECFEENDVLEFGYGLFTADHLHTLKNHYLLHQKVSFPPDWDIALTGYVYGDLLFEHGAADARRARFTFDRLASKAQAKAVGRHVKTFVPDADPVVAGSRQSPGIQAADCFAGAVAEDYKSDTEWLEYIDEERITRTSNTALAHLEHDLENHPNRH